VGAVLILSVFVFGEHVERGGGYGEAPGGWRRSFR
jgi:hypothetical protein